MLCYQDATFRFTLDDFSCFFYLGSQSAQFHPANLYHPHGTILRANITLLWQYSNVTRCLTFNELINSVPRGQSTFQSQEVILLSGVHVVNGTERQDLTVSHIGDLTMRGESNNVTIVCMEGLLLYLHVPGIKLTYLTLQDCKLQISFQGTTIHSRLILNMEGNVVFNSWVLVITALHSWPIQGFLQRFSYKQKENVL